MLVQALVGENHGSEDTRLLLERVDDACSQISGILVATVGEEKGKQRMSISVLAVELLWLNTGPLAVESLLRRVHDNVGYTKIEVRVVDEIEEAIVHRLIHCFCNFRIG